MRILQIAPPWYPVPPTGYGGIEWIVSSLADNLTALGHDVTLVANGESETSAELISVFDTSMPQHLGDVWMEAAHAVRAYAQAGDVDVIHDHTGIVGPAIAAAGGLGVPVVNTLHGAWTPENTVLYRSISRDVTLTAISHDQALRAPAGVRVAAVVHNGIELDAYEVGRQREDFLLFVGRASEEKGPEVAIEVARRTGMPLVMAMKVSHPDEHRYFEDVVLPLLEDADVDVRTEVGHDEKAELMMRARAVVVPIGWDEPFGLVMAEAAASGAPVIAFRRGSASELVLDGISGRLVPPGDVGAMTEAVEGIGDIDPLDCRAWAEGRFSAHRMVDRYVRVYEELTSRGFHPDASATNGAVSLPERVGTGGFTPATTSRLLHPSAGGRGRAGMTREGQSIDGRVDDRLTVDGAETDRDIA